ncbi:unnamed protein product [Pedinophyceae sp. YPF-701]|nr:unnamed protein product [Pedinophyceae sp. YPF-701]
MDPAASDAPAEPHEQPRSASPPPGHPPTRSADVEGQPVADEAASGGGGDQERAADELDFSAVPEPGVNTRTHMLSRLLSFVEPSLQEVLSLAEQMHAAREVLQDARSRGEANFGKELQGAFKSLEQLLESVRSHADSSLQYSELGAQFLLKCKELDRNLQGLPQVAQQVARLRDFVERIDRCT